MTPTRRSRCRTHRTTLDAVLDGRERLAALQSLELHADDCGECAHALSESRALRAGLDALSAPEFDRASDDAFVAGVMGRLGEVDVAGSVISERTRWSALRPVALVLAAAAAILLIVRSDQPEAPEDISTAGLAAPTAAIDVPPVDEAGADAQETQPSPTTLPPVVQEASTQVATADLAAVLDAIAAEGTFDPYTSRHANEFVHDVRARIDGDVGAAARTILSGEDAPRRAAFAARLLGPNADYRDRDLLARAIDSIGSPAAFALADRGGSGVERLWRIATAEGAAAQLARTTLCVLAAEGDAGRDPFEQVPRSTPLHIVASVVAADPLDGAARALDEYLASGDPIWMSVLIEHERCIATVDDAVLGGVRQRDRKLLLKVIQRTGGAGTADFVVANMERGNSEAVDALAALPTAVALESLIAATRAGQLYPEIEESAWRALVRGDAAAIAELAAGSRTERHSDIDLVLDALVRAEILETDDESQAAARELVLSLAALDDADPRMRIAALLHVSSSAKADHAFSAVERAHLDHLLSVPDIDVAAAAWLVRARDGDRAATAPVNVRRALERGGDPAVRLLRVARALDRDRVAAARRARGADAAP